MMMTMLLQKRQGQYSSVGDGLSSSNRQSTSSNQPIQTTSSLTRGQTIGVIVGIIVFIVLFLASLWFCCARFAKKRERRREKEREEMEKHIRETTIQQQQNLFERRDSAWETNPVTIEMPNAAMTYQDFLAYQRRGSDNSTMTEEELMKKQQKDQQQIDPIPVADQYIVSFDQNGEPHYHFNNNTSQIGHLPNEQHAIYQART